MITYRDMTFCGLPDCAKYPGCPRAITDEVREGAEETGMMLSMALFEECFEGRDRHSTLKAEGRGFDSRHVHNEQ